MSNPHRHSAFRSPGGARPASPSLSRRRFLARAAAGAAVAGAGAAARPLRSATLDAGRIRETVFPSGLRLVVKEARATDLASVQVWIRAGGFLEDETTAGTAHVIEHLVFKGADSRGPGSIDFEIENLGGLLEASTDKDHTRFTCSVNGRYIARVLSIIADTLRAPRFRPEDFEAEKPVMREEIERVRTSPEAAVSLLLYDLAFKSHPYRHDVRGTHRFLNQLDLQAVRAYYQQNYLPSRMTVVVVGDVDPAGAERVTRAAFEADRPAAAAPLKLPPDERACSVPDRRVLTGGFAGGYLGIAFPAPSVRDVPDVHAMDVLLTLLEQGGTGRLPRLLKGSAGVRATYETRRQPGLFIIFAAAGGDDLERVEALLRRELELVATRPIPEAEVAMAKRALRGSYILDNEAYSGQAATLGYYDAIDRWQFAAEYLDKVQAVTLEQVREVAGKYLRPENSVSVLLKPRRGGPPPRPGA